MHLIQWIILLFAAIAEAAVLVGFRRGRVTPRGIIFWTLVWLLVGIVAVWPNATYVVADVVGITRGADLVLYLGLLLVFFILFRGAVRMEKIERDLAAIVRVLALRDVSGPADSEKSASEEPPPAEKA